MTGVGEALALSLLALWLTATVLGQLPGTRWQAFRRRANFMGLLPYWGFFTSRLCTKDYHLCWRPVTASGITGEWNEAGPGARDPRPAWSALWHPERRPCKALLDMGLALVTFQTVQKLDLPMVRKSPLYLTLEEFCRRPARAAGATAFQFAVLASHGRESNRPRSLYFLSDLHET